MPARLNRSAYAHAERLIRDGACVDDNRDAWSEHRPSASDEDEFISRHGFRAYGKWHLGIDEEFGKDSKARYKFPYGDFAKVHRCALLAGRPVWLSRHRTGRGPSARDDRGRVRRLAGIRAGGRARG